MVQEGGEHPDSIRCKVNCTGINASRIWRDDHTFLGDIREINTAGCRVVPIVQFGRAWFSGGMYGVSLELRAAVISDTMAPELEEFPL